LRIFCAVIAFGLRGVRDGLRLRLGVLNSGVGFCGDGFRLWRRASSGLTDWTGPAPENNPGNHRDNHRNEE